MRKPLILVSVMALGVGLLAGCGTPDVSSNTIIVEKNGKITEALVEDFEQDYYNEEELKAFVEEEIAAYEAEHEKGAVKMSGLAVEEGVASMTMTYADAATYKEFHNTNFYVGTVVDAQTAGYKFDVMFAEVTEGSAGSATVSGDDVMAAEGNVLVIQDYIDVQVPGTITYVSEGVQVTGSGSATIAAVNETDVAPVAYIVYK